MSFNQMVRKMIRHDARKYIFYLVCNSLAVMLFFIYAALFYNDDVTKAKMAETIQYALIIPGIALIVFTVFFISHAHHLFIKSRKREFGLFRTLGMTNRDVVKLLVMENGLIACLSIITGLLSGLLFSRLFFSLLTTVLNIQTISYGLNVQMFAATIMVYLLVFATAVGRTLYMILTQNLILTLKSDRVGEVVKLNSPLLGGIGAGLIIFSVAGLYLTYTGNQGDDYIFIWMILTMVGLYFSINQLSSLLIKMVKKSKRMYYKNLLSLSSLDYKFKQLTSTLMLVSVMIMVTVLYSTIVLFTYLDTARQIEERHPYDLAFLQTAEKNQLTEEQLYSIVDTEENHVQAHDTLPVFTFFQEDEYAGWISTFHLVSVQTFNQITSNSIEVKAGEYIFHPNQPAADPDGAYEFQLKFEGKAPAQSYIQDDTFVQSTLNYLGGEFILVNEEDFDALKTHLNGFDATMNFINVADWKSAFEVTRNLEAAFAAVNQRTPSVTSEADEGTSDERLFSVASKMEDAAINRQTDGLTFFVISFLSVLFLIGSFVILYLNLFSNIEKERLRFSNLHRIGVTVPEIKKAIAKELIPVFFIPTLTGITLALLYMIAMATDIGGILQNPDVLVNFAVIAGVYFILQIGFYFYSKWRMVAAVVKGF
ncbi:ABC transporter permease [Jeotgalibacillus terrae]|uniref:FtsX-like permease family protein n=1 Tax=Jeotgalibacillus terrae TaxID=587735 RepID=A0ABW5ZJJ3_9BACL|nr:ABC transporter permease [Jeotgalibacillus terrae]MBM7578628.1 ABC-type antimicrobial peptide transport system permease subunit [Jeotgalibacillus terrae]